MCQRLWLVMVMILGLGTHALAEESNPMERALRALALKNRSNSQAFGTTACAYTNFWVPNIAQGNSTTAFASSQTNSAAAQQNQEDMIITPEKLKQRLSWAKDIHPFLIVYEQCDPIVLTTTAAASVSNTATGKLDLLEAVGTTLTAIVKLNPMEAVGTTLAASGTQSLPNALSATTVALAETSGNTPAGSTFVIRTKNAFIDPWTLTATASAETITLSWSNTGTAFKDFLGYKILKAPFEQIMTWVGNTPQAVSTYQDSTVTAKVHYVYQVLAISAKGQTLSASWPIQIEMLPSLPPETPQELQSIIHEERVQLKWKEPTRTSHAIAGYHIYRREPVKEQVECLTTTPVAKTEYYDDKGIMGKTYEYQIVAVDTWGLTSPASTSVNAYARPRERNGLILMSTAYRGMGCDDTGLTGDMQFTYYIGTLYGQQDKELSPVPLYLDPISLWMLSADVKYTGLTESQFPVAMALGGKGSVLLFAGQQQATGGSFTFSQKSEFNYTWGGYLTLSRSIGEVGFHGGYLLGTEGDPIFYLSKYMRFGEAEHSRNLFYFGVDFPITRRMNAACEFLYPLDAELRSRQHPILVNLHIDRLFNFDISYLQWDQGWAFLGYFNIRFTIYPGSWK